MPGQRYQANRNHIRPSAWLRYGLQVKRPIPNMEITLFRDDKNLVGRDWQPFRDKAYRHFGIVRQYLMQQCGHRSKVRYDENGHAHVARQVAQQLDIGLEPTG